jgi:hypothetical protein
MKPYVDDLLELAADDADPSLYADVILDQAERRQPAVVDFLRAKLTADPGAVALFEQQFYRAFPAATQYREWFTELLKELGDALRQENTPPSEARAPEPPAPGGTDSERIGGKGKPGAAAPVPLRVEP